ncbi:trans-aconitate 2-methyltransferase [Kineococcus xinjiangensis]|uniref:Trans-aconitate 2-methyltransferase n=1 Tax=Kineococcus xinjiangensis TaxID=512762 RepID=A0A2S6IKJ0_9ACTN|nr:methyltransferase domain-containing protein [Kineococcus xinjiangensis]PPK94719.1 trans-aconitate 2-methyltransferase [Kineococcus xinjiangensis]
MTEGTRWDPEVYLRHAGERSRPFADLLARVAAERPGAVVDLGCGAGNLTVVLARRWPGARVVGVDSSAEMLERARRDAAHERVEYVAGDAREWEPAAPVDVLVSNAVLQWIPGHLELLPRLVSMLAAGGELAVQVPANFAAPTHALLRRVCSSPRWARRLDGPAEAGSAEPVEYLRVLAATGAAVDVWETTYLHVLAGPDAVLGWMRGTALRPVLSVLEEAEQEEFCAEYGALLRVAYPQEGFGTVLPYRRVFAVARRPG